MPAIKTKDGTEIYYKDWGSGQPIVFHHGWPLSADDWDFHMQFFLMKGYRVIAHDRRGHGRSNQPTGGHEMNTYAADVTELTAALDLKGAVHIGHSTGGGEVARYVARATPGRVSKAALISAVPPIMVKEREKPRRPADGSLRWLPGGTGRQPRAILQGCAGRPVLRIQSPGRETDSGRYQ
jgi:non-heme chloroperoxidase